MQIVYTAIDRSKSHDEIVHLSLSDLAHAEVTGGAARKVLLQECEGEAVNATIDGGEHEFWGQDMDGVEWRVHVQLPKVS